MGMAAVHDTVAPVSRLSAEEEEAPLQPECMPELPAVRASSLAGLESRQSA